MSQAYLLQLRMTLLTLCDLQMQSETPEQYEITITKIKQRIQQLSDHNLFPLASVNAALGDASGFTLTALRACGRLDA